MTTGVDSEVKEVGVLVRDMGQVVWTYGGMEESGMDSVMRESIVGWYGDLLCKFFRGKIEVSTS
jgi:hypothetical protein